MHNGHAAEQPNRRITPTGAPEHHSANGCERPEDVVTGLPVSGHDQLNGIPHHDDVDALAIDAVLMPAGQADHGIVTSFTSKDLNRRLHELPQTRTAAELA